MATIGRNPFLEARRLAEAARLANQAGGNPQLQGGVPQANGGNVPRACRNQRGAPVGPQPAPERAQANSNGQQIAAAPEGATQLNPGNGQPGQPKGQGIRIEDQLRIAMVFDPKSVRDLIAIRLLTGDGDRLVEGVRWARL